MPGASVDTVTKNQWCCNDKNICLLFIYCVAFYFILSEREKTKYPGVRGLVHHMSSPLLEFAIPQQKNIFSHIRISFSWQLLFFIAKKSKETNWTAKIFTVQRVLSNLGRKVSCKLYILVRMPHKQLGCLLLNILFCCSLKFFLKQLDKRKEGKDQPYTNFFVAI